MVLYPILSKSQEKLNKLQAPTSPASSIIGMQPSSILSPKTYQALETAIYSNFLNENGNVIIPNNFALEFTPYWNFTKKDTLSLDEYLYPKKLTDQFVRNFSFSIASTQNFQLGDSSSTNALAFGFRTTLYFSNKQDRDTIEKYKHSLNTNKLIAGHVSSEAESLLINNKVKDKAEFIFKIKIKVVETINEIFPNASDVVKNQMIEEIVYETNKINLDLNNYTVFLNTFYNVIDQVLKGKETFEKFKKHIKNRPGLSVDLAYANFLNFPSNNFDFSFIPRQSFWLTPTYNFRYDFNFLKIMGVIRYEWYDIKYFKNYFLNSKIYENNLDYGFGISTQFDKFSIKIEVVGRESETEIPAGFDTEGNELFRRDKSSDIQYLGSFNYNLTDQIVLSYSVGNRFEPILNPTNTLVSLLSLNFGFGTPTENNIKFKN